MEETNLNLPPEVNLSDQLAAEIRYEYASTWQRFFNLVIDNILMRYGLSYLTGSAVGMLLGIIFPDYIMRVINEPEAIDLWVIGYAIAIVNWLVYYTICEKAFRGYTLGKLITGTRAVREDGGELTFKDAFLRSLSRLVPFEWFSGFGGHPWHDTWTKTMVVKSR